MKITMTLLTLFVLFLPITPAQESTQWVVLEGVIARLGWSAIHEIQYAPNDTRVAVATSVGVFLCDTIVHRVGNDWSRETVPLTETDWVFTVAFSPDGTTLARGSGDKTIRLWEVASGEQKRVFTGHTSDVSGVVYSPDGSVLVSADSAGTVRLWKVAD